MAQPKHFRASLLPESLRELAEQLASLSKSEREAVVEAAGTLANDVQPVVRTASWDSIDAAKGIVSWGGNALEDSEAIYDG